MSITTTDIHNIAQLARLAIDEQKSHDYAQDLSKILAMMDILSDVNTDDIKPLTNVHDMHQVLRSDTPNAAIDREANQSVAPQVAEGLYLVPQVIE